MQGTVMNAADILSLSSASLSPRCTTAHAWLNNYSEEKLI